MPPDSKVDWAKKFEEFSSDPGIKVTLEALNFPTLTDPVQIETFFKALQGGTEINAAGAELAVMLNLKPNQLERQLLTLRHADQGNRWGEVDHHGEEERRGGKLER